MKLTIRRRRHQCVQAKRISHAPWPVAIAAGSRDGQGAMVCRLAAGGNWIRNFSSALRRQGRASQRCAMQPTRFDRTTVKRWVGDLETRSRNVIRP